MRYGRIAFALGIIASGVLNIVNGDFSGAWLPSWLPTHGVLAYLCGALMVLAGLGLLVERAAAVSARVLFVFTLLWLVVINTPRLFSMENVSLNWLDWGEIAVIVAGTLALAATNEMSVRVARYLFGIAVIPIGISHFTFLSFATHMVPAALPYHAGWVIFTGIAHIAAAVAIVIGVYAPLAALLEASMITSFALLVWVMPIIAQPTKVSLWFPEVLTLAVAGGAWAIASTMPVKSKTLTVL